MPIYRFQSGSLIDEVSIVKNDAGGFRAYLHAGNAADVTKLGSARDQLRQAGLKLTPIQFEGKACLEVRGFEKPEDFMQLLVGKGLLVGQPKQELFKEEQEKEGLGDKLNNNTLRHTGWLYNIGDVAFMTYTLKEKGLYKKKLAGSEALLKKALSTGNQEAIKTHTNDVAAVKDDLSGSKLKIGAGLGYALGGIILTGFASKDQSEKHIAKTQRKMNHFMRREGLDVSEASTSKTLTQTPRMTPWEKAKDFVSTYPSEMLNLVYVGVGALLMSASIKYRNAPQKSYENEQQWKRRKNTETIDIGLGMVTGSSALAGLLISEKKPDEDDKKRSGIGGVVDWIREKPLRATGYGFMVATAFHAWATARKWHKGEEEVRKTIIGRAIFVITNVAAEILIAISSKGHGIGVKADESVDSTIIATAAQTILEQPEEKRAALIERMAGYMSSPDVLGGKPAEIKENLIKAIAAIAENPWASKSQIPSSTSAETTTTAAVNAPAAPAPKNTVSSISAEKRLAELQPNAVLSHAS